MFEIYAAVVEGHRKLVKIVATARNLKNCQLYRRANSVTNGELLVLYSVPGMAHDAAAIVVAD
jgi:hypothetical protein